jgi:hypothetical protein
LQWLDISISTQKAFNSIPHLVQQVHSVLGEVRTQQHDSPDIFQAPNIILSDKSFPSDKHNVSAVTWKERLLQYYQSDKTIATRLL